MISHKKIRKSIHKLSFKQAFRGIPSLMFKSESRVNISLIKANQKTDEGLNASVPETNDTSLSSKCVSELNSSPMKIQTLRDRSNSRRTFRIHSTLNEINQKPTVHTNVNTHNILKKKIDYFYSPYSMRKKNPNIQHSQANTSFILPLNDRMLDLSFKTEKMKIAKQNCIQICRRANISNKQISSKKTYAPIQAKCVDQSTNTEEENLDQSLSICANSFVPYCEIVNSFNIDQTYQNLSREAGPPFKVKSTSIARKVRYINNNLQRKSNKRIYSKSRIVLRDPKNLAVSFDLTSN